MECLLVNDNIIANWWWPCQMVQHFLLSFQTWQAVKKFNMLISGHYFFTFFVLVASNLNFNSALISILHSQDRLPYRSGNWSTNIRKRPPFSPKPFYYSKLLISSNKHLNRDTTPLGRGDSTILLHADTNTNGMVVSVYCTKIRRFATK